MVERPDALRPESGRYRPAPFFLLIVAVTALTLVAGLVDRRTIAVVQARDLLPRWDLATHLGHGWLDYHLLVTGRVFDLLWDLWLQGYWPPVLSLFQVPFFVILGGEMSSGLRAGLAAFVLTGAIGCAVLWRTCRTAALLPASLFLALLMSSPFLLAYASVTMTEMLGAAVQLFVLLSYALYREHPSSRGARLFAVALTTLFFTKYNYFFLLMVPLVLYEWLERTAGQSASRRLTTIWHRTHTVVSSPAGAFIAIYIVALALIVRTGGFDFHVGGHRISVHTIGNTGQVVLYVLLARLWYLHRRRRIDWPRIIGMDPRVRPLLLWFVVPVAIWFASPYPNHIRDFANLVINRPLGEPTVESGLATYTEALRTTYFYCEAVLWCVALAFVIAVVRFRKHSPAMQVLLIAVPLQFAVIALHQTRFPRFLLQTVVLFCVAAAGEVGRWINNHSRRRVAAGSLAPLVLASGVLAANRVVDEDRFRAVAFEHYTDSESLRNALRVLRMQLGPDDRTAIVGQSNELSPALWRWQLGPPSGVACFPYEIGGARRLDLALATRVLLLEPLNRDSTPLDATTYYEPQRRAVLERVERGEFALQREFPLTDLRVMLKVYGRASPPPDQAPCQ
jgi:hypothetical protein